MNIKGTKTEQNLRDAFAGESQARNMYTYFASKAKKDGFVEISQIFEATANNEKEHAKIWFKLLQEGGEIGTTLDNLLSAAAGEHHETAEMYPTMAKEAREEGFEAIAVLFDQVGAIEKHHEMRYRKLAEQVKNGTVFTSEDANTAWECGNCGHVHVGAEAVNTCPVCRHPKAYFFAR
ncbi:MAG: rubrerythrin family protein [Oscillospiraceae bacterium]|nr:rubrerythrin family protein [Oscillospiraceae bacterium]